MPRLDRTFLRAATEIVGPRQVLVDPDLVSGYVSDWTGRFRGVSPAVVRPGSTEEVEALVALCRDSGIALVLQGGNTGLSGGAVPLAGEVVCSLRRLVSLEVDEESGQAVAGAGVTLADLQAAAEAVGWAYGVDLASRGSATVGGSVATNAGGIHMIRYGDTRAQLLGVTAVLGRAETISHLGGLLKDNTGYFLPGLLCGCEGTLGVVTAARLRLVRPSPQRVVALLGFGDERAAFSAIKLLRRGPGTLSAMELFFRPGMALVCQFAGLADPFDEPYHAYLLVEASDQHDPTAELANAVDSLADVGGVAVASDAVRVAELWRYRESHTEAINHRGTPHKLDIAVPISALAEFCQRVHDAVKTVAPSAEVWLFGHAGDGNMHVNVTGVPPDSEEVDEAVFVLAASLGGSVSAEHGIGTAKRRWLHLNRTPAEIEVFKWLKAAFDPDGILNPSVLLPGDEART